MSRVSRSVFVTPPLLVYTNQYPLNTYPSSSPARKKKFVLSTKINLRLLRQLVLMPKKNKTHQSFIIVRQRLVDVDVQ